MQVDEREKPSFKFHKCSWYCEGDIHALEMKSLYSLSERDFRRCFELGYPDIDGHYWEFISAKEVNEIGEDFDKRVSQDGVYDTSKCGYAYLAFLRLREG